MKWGGREGDRATKKELRQSPRAISPRPRSNSTPPAVTMDTKALGLVLLLVAGAHAAMKLPSYIKTCSRNDPNLNECALRNGKAAIPHLLNGDPKIKLPTLLPLRIEEIRVDQQGSVGLNLVLRDVDLVGIDRAELRSVRFDLKNNNLGIDIFLPQIQLIGNYNMSGRILILPIYGKGGSNITLDNVPLNYTMHYEMVTRKGKEYMKVLSNDVGFDTTQAYFRFENLFNGDERLRENVRQVVNDNWRQVIQDVGPSVAGAIGDVVTQLLKNVLTTLPFEEIFPETSE